MGIRRQDSGLSSRILETSGKQLLRMQTSSWYSRFAKAAARFCGRPRVFVLAVAVILLWVITGPMFDFSDTWQLVINTGTTIVTFLMVFLIQNTQTRDTEAIQIKLDELIRATRGAHNALLDLEELDEAALEASRTKYEALASAARTKVGGGGRDTDTPEP
jgi:low affinity Fe/Cu permease